MIKEHSAFFRIFMLSLAYKPRLQTLALSDEWTAYIKPILAAVGALQQVVHAAVVQAGNVEDVAEEGLPHCAVLNNQKHEIVKERLDDYPFIPLFLTPTHTHTGKKGKG